MIQVYLYGKFRNVTAGDGATRKNVIQVEWKPGLTIRDIVVSLGLPPEEVAHAFLDGQYSSLKRKVKPGARLGLFPRELGLLYRQYFPVHEGEERDD